MPNEIFLHAKDNQKPTTHIHKERVKNVKIYISKRLCQFMKFVVNLQFHTCSFVQFVVLICFNSRQFV